MRVLIFMLLCQFSLGIYADYVMQSDRVVSSLRIREAPVSGVAVIGAHLHGENARYLSSESRYFRNRTSDGVIGFFARSHSTRIFGEDFLMVVTWNLEGPGGADGNDLPEFTSFFDGADVIVLEELRGADQLADALAQYFSAEAYAFFQLGRSKTRN